MMILGLTACGTTAPVKRMNLLMATEAPIITPLTVSEASETLSDFIRNHDTTVLYWWSNTCPCVRRYQERVEQLAHKYQTKGVGFIAVASNSDDSIYGILETASARKLQLPIAIDKDGVWATSLRVTRTPTVLLINNMGQILFTGWIDNERKQGEPDRIPYLENAILANLHGMTAPSNSPIRGCQITRFALRTGPDCHCTE